MPPVKSVIPSNPKSKVWRHFGDSLDGEFAQCLICKDSKTIAIHIKVCGGSTQSLRNHIKFHHKKEFRDMEKEEADEVKVKERIGVKVGNTPKISEAFQKMTKVDPQGQKQACSAVPAASSKSERVFSVAGNTVIPKRASLDPGKVEDLVIVKTNLTLLREFGYKI